jgi:hypothetical protein
LLKLGDAPARLANSLEAGEPGSGQLADALGPVQGIVSHGNPPAFAENGFFSAPWPPESGLLKARDEAYMHLRN